MLKVRVCWNSNGWHGMRGEHQRHDGHGVYEEHREYGVGDIIQLDSACSMHFREISTIKNQLILMLALLFNDVISF